MKINLMGLDISADTKAEILAAIRQRAASGQKTFIVTPYSEFYWHAARDPEFRRALGAADLSLPDGISVLWLSYYLSVPLTATGYYTKIMQALWQQCYTLLDIFVSPDRLYRTIPEKIPGADFFWDLVAFAVENDKSIFLLGGYGDTPMLVRSAVLKRFPQARIAGISNAPSDSASIVDEINKVKPDVLLVAFGPVKQEKWIYKNLAALNVSVAIGLGGTFDYVAGLRSQPPRWIRTAGLEWLYRLITQPSRFVRIWHATFHFLRGALREKVFMSLPFRDNVIGVIINREHKIFLAMSKQPNDPYPDWKFPQGGIERGEDPNQAALREIKEETGMHSLTVLGFAKQEYSYIWPLYSKKLWFTADQFRFRGQRQRICYLRYDGDNSELDFEHDPDFKLKRQKFTEYKWLAPEALDAAIEPVRREVLKLILAELPQYLNI